jgi:fibronectin-binding autotransporter adhesin
VELWDATNNIKFYLRLLTAHSNLLHNIPPQSSSTMNSSPHRKIYPFVGRFGIAVAMAVFVLAPSSVFAASQTWDGSDSNDWSTAANWVGNAVPGSTSDTNSADVATFNAAVANNQIVIDANRNISGLTFNGSSGNYTIGTTAGNALRMTASGTILIGNGLTTNNKTITINAPLLMYGMLTINNQAPNATNKFVIGGDISAANTGVKTISLQSVSASSTNMNEITGLISNGNATATVAVSQSTSGGNWRLLNDANSFTGNLTVQGGSVWVSSIGDQGVASAAGAGTTINIGGSTSSGSLYFIGTGQTTNRTINLAGTTGGANIYANNASGLLKFTSNFTASGAGNKTLTLRGTGAGGAEIAGSIVNNNATNTTSVTKIDSGTWILSGNNTYTGATTVGGGTLSINSIADVGQASAAGAGTTINLGNGATAATLLYTGTGHTTNKTVDLLGRSVALTLNASGSGLLKFTSNFTSTGLGNKTLVLSGSGSGEIAGSIVDAASGVVWTNTNYTGGNTSLNLGSTIGITANVSTVSGNFIVPGTIVTLVSGSTVTLSNATLTGNISSGATVLTIDGVRNPTAVTKSDAGTWTLSGNNTYTGATTINGGTLSIATITNGGVSGSLGNSTTNATNLVLGGGTLEYTGSASGSTNRDFTLTAGTTSGISVTNSTASLTMSGNAATTTGGLTKVGAGTLVLSGANTYTGTTTVSAGNLTLTGGSAISNSGAVTLANTAGAILHVAQSETIGTLSGGGAIGGNVSIAGGQSLGITATSTFNGSITGAGALVKSGANTLTLNGSSDYTGGTTINLGTLSAGANNALGNGALTINASGSNTFLNLNGTNQTITSLTVLGANASVIQNQGGGNGTMTFNLADGVTSNSTSMFYFRDQSSGTGTLALVKTGNGTLDFSVLNAANTAYSGGLTVNGGTFSYNSTATTAALGSGSITLGGGTLNYTGSSSVTIANNATLTAGTTSTLNNANGTVTISATIAGSGNLTKSGAGTLTLSGANTYTGDTLVSAGTLTLSNALALQNSTIDTSGAGVITLSSVTTPTFGGLKGSGNLSSVITTGYSSVTGITLNPDSSVSNTYSGVISDGAAGMTLTKNGSGTQVLSGSNTYTGATTINAGTLQLGHANALGATTSGLVVNGTLDLNGNSITKSTLSGSTGNITSVSAATLTFNRTNATIGTYNGTIGGDVALLITNSNNSGTSTVLTLGGSNTYTGNTTIYNSALAIRNGAALGNSTVIVQKGGQSTAAYGGELRISNNITVSNNMTLAGAGYGGFNGALRSTSGNNIVTGTITSSDTDTRIRADAATLTLNGDINLTAASAYTTLFVHNGGDIRLGGNITGSATQIGVIGGSSSYLITDRANAWGTTRSLYLGVASQTQYGRVDLNGFDQTVTGISVTGTDATQNIITNRSGTLATLTINGASSTSVTFSGNLAISKTGNSTLTLSGNNTYTGGTLVSGSASRLDASHVSALGVGNVTITTTGGSAGAFVGLQASGTYANNFTINGTGTGNGAIQGFSNATLSGLVTLAGDAMIASRTTAGNSTLTLTGGITSGGSNRTLTLNTSNTNQLTISTNSVNLGAGGTLDIGHGLAVGNQTGTFNLNVGNNTWGTTIVRGLASTGNSSTVTLNIGEANALGSSSVLQLGNSTTSLEQITVNLNGNNQTIGVLRSFTGNGSASANGNRTVTSATAATLTIDNSSATNYLYDGVISGGISLVKNGTGTQTLSGTNTYTGTTTINAGALTITSSSSLPGFSTNGSYSVANGATLGVYNAVTDADMASMLGTTNFAAGSAIGFDTTTANRTYSIALADTSQGVLGLTKLGSNTLTLNGSNTYTGATTINAGTLQIGAGSTTGSISSSSDITNNGTLAINRSNDLTLGNTISGSGALTKAGAGNLTLSGSNSYTGNTTISAGAVLIQNANALGTTAGGTIVSSGGSLRLQGGITITGEALTLDGGGASNTGALRNISGDNTWTGNINSSGATTYIGSDSGLLTLSGNISNTNSTWPITFSGSGNILVSGNISGTGNSTVAKRGTGTLTLSGDNTFTGSLSATEGTVSISSIGNVGEASAAGAGTTINIGGAALNGILLYTGSAATSNKTINLSTATIYSSTITQNGSGLLKFTSDFTATVGGNKMLVINGSGLGEIAGAIVNNTGNLTSLTKNGTGTWTLSGNNTYTGATTVSAGVLNLTGSNTGSATAINSGGTLIGTGTAGAVTVNSGGIIGAGNATGAVGTLSVGSLTINGGSGYTFTIGDVNGSAAGTDYDQISSAGALALNNTAANPFTIYLDGTPTGWSNSGNYTWNIISAASQTGFNSGNFALDFTSFGIASGNRTGIWNFTNPSTGNISLTYTASAGDAIWSGGAGNWSTGFSYSPTTDTSITFDGVGGVATNNIPSGTLSAVNFITFNSTGAYTLNATTGAAGLSGGTPLTVKGDIINNSASTQTINMDLALLGSSTGIINTASGNITIGGVISGAGDLTKTGTGTLTLSGNNTYTGQLTVAEGTLSVATLNNSGAAGVLGNSTNSVILGSSGKNGTLSYTGGATLTVNKTFTMAAGGTGVLDVGTGGQLTVGVISGSGALSKTGAGNLVLGSSNTYSGGTTLGGSGLVAVTVDSAGTAGSPTSGAFGTGMVTLAGAELRSGASTSRTVANAITISADTTFATVANEKSLTFTGPVTLSGATRTLNVAIGSTVSTEKLTFSGDIGDGGNGYGITKNGGGQLTLSGNNTYSGGTIINAGRLNVSTTSGFGTGNVTIASGAFTGITHSGTMTNNITIAGSGTGNGAIQSFGSNATLSGLVTLSADAMIAMRTTAGSGNLNLTGGITSGGTNRTLTLNTWGNATQTNNQLTISTNSVNLGTGGTLDIGHGLNAGGAGIFNLNVGNNTWGTTIVRGFASAGNSSSATLNLGVANALGSSSVLQLGNSTTSLEQITVNLNGNNQTIGGLRSFGFGSTGSASANGNRTVTSNTAATLTIDNSSATNYLYDGVISGGISLVKNGTATQTLTGNNTYTGATTISAGNLSISTVSAVGSTSGINLANATSLIYTGSAATLDRAISVTGTTGSTGTIRNESAGLLTLSGTLSKNGTTLALQGGNGGITVSGSIVGSNANSDLIIDGGSVTLAAANTYNGPTTIKNGATLNTNISGALPIANGRSDVLIDPIGSAGSTLVLGASQSIASLSGAASSNVTLGSNTITIGNTSGNTTYAGRITGGSSSALVKDGASTQVLTGNNTGFTGTTTINSGTLQAASAGALGGTSNIDITGGTLLVTVDDAINGKNIELGGSGVGLQFSGNYSGAIGNLTLSANSIIDLGAGSVQILFQGLTSSNHTLSFYNWSGTTLWNGGNGTTDTDKVYFGPDLSDEALAKIYFYTGPGDSFLGSGFDLGLKPTGFDPAMGHQIIPVPEPETYATGLLLLLGGAWWMWKRNRKSEACSHGTLLPCGGKGK